MKDREESLEQEYGGTLKEVVPKELPDRCCLTTSEGRN
jgi:hypothetical protein